VDFDPGAATFALTSAGNADVFINKLDANGNFAWAVKMGGSALDYGLSIVLDDIGNIHSTGNFSGTSADFDPGPNTHYLYGKGYTDVFVSKLTAISQAQFSGAGDRDGWIRESAETSGAGGAMNSTSTTLNLGDDVANREYRAILAFNTTSLPDNAVITRVTLKVKKNSVVGGGDPLSTFQGFKVDIKRGAFGAGVLELGDFSASANGTYGPVSPALSASGWYSLNLTAGRNHINRQGSTQLRMRFQLDDNHNGVANILKLYSGNAGGAQRPQLIIQYYLP
jgi:hypothetical protein